ncbi:MAG: thiamine pyrophosphate-dependent enzyme [Thermoleophilia bacterium]|nr:thiamine pyrophosphate-dependent enzyme [Thermoleophilia bacterium]
MEPFHAEPNYIIEEAPVFSSGHNACPGCGEALAVRYVLNSMGPKTVAVIPPSCIAIISGPQPYSSMRIPVYQTTLEASAASAAGIRRALVRQGKDDVNVLVIAGDGGTYDIGFQALSGAAERNEDMVYVCLDNEGYMNTGAQKSSSTPYLAYTTSTPGGKPNDKKDIAEIMAAHRVPYVATATVGYPEDLARKVAKAKEMRGLRFIVVLTPCLDGWGVPDDGAVRVSRLAVQTGFFPLYEVEEGERYAINVGPTPGWPVERYLETQRRYRHLTADQVAAIQAHVDHKWSLLHARAKVECVPMFQGAEI